MIQSEWLKPDNLTDESLIQYKNIEDLFTCPICFEMLKEPVTCTECSGTMCLNCRVSDQNNINYEKQLMCALCCTKAACKSSRETIRFLDTSVITDPHSFHES